MLHKFWIPIFLCVIVILVGCDQGSKMMKPVLTPEPPIPISAADPPSEPPLPVEQPTDTQETVYPEITFENVLDLQRGARYRMRPTESHEGKGDEGVIYSVSWGNVGGHPPDILEGFTEDQPKLRAWFSMTNDDGRAPYAKTIDGKPVIEKEPVWDEIVIEIVENQWGGGIAQTGGPRGDKFEFTLVEYSAILIENLTHPDRKFEYE